MGAGCRVLGADTQRAPPPAGRELDHLALEHPRFSPTTRGGAAGAAPAPAPASAPPPPPPAPPLELPPAWAGAGLPSSGAGGQPYPSPLATSTAEGRGSPARKGAAAARLAAGEPPWDMLSLKAAVVSARPGAAPAGAPRAGAPRMAPHCWQRLRAHMLSTPF
jgi:hypothetical protein